MSETVQTIAVVAIILGAIGYLIARARRKAACNSGGDCNCSVRKQ